MNAIMTEMIYRTDNGATSPTFLGGENFKATGDLPYFGSIISFSCSTDKEIKNRIRKASSALAQ